VNTVNQRPWNRREVIAAKLAASLALASLSRVSLAAMQQPVDRPPQPRLEAILTLKLPKLSTGSLPTYYSPGSEARARALQAFIEGERAFYREKLGVPLNDLVLAVLGPQYWEPVSGPIPYGMPSVEGNPRVILMPSDWNKVTAMALPVEANATPALRSKAAVTGMTWQALMHRGADGIDAQNHWFNEFLASYIGDVYIVEKWPQDIAANHILWEACLEWAHPHTTLADFDTHYDEIMENDPKNYAWYQCALDQRVIAVHNSEGIGFLPKVKAAFPKGGPALTSAQVLDKLEAMDPGWKAWAAQLESK
jgi:hypothetical protein